MRYLLLPLALALVALLAFSLASKPGPAAAILSVPGAPAADGFRSAPLSAISTTVRVSVGPGGIQANGASDNPSISSDGQIVAFESYATNLAMNTGAVRNVFVHNRSLGQTSLVSLGWDGGPPNGSSANPAISADGRYVAFESSASNLITSGDTYGYDDVFVRDLLTGNTSRASISSAGTQADGHSSHAALSSDGRYVAFESTASNLVVGDSNYYRDIFVRDRQSNTTARVSVASDGTEANGASYAPAISADGRYVSFYSGASNLVAGDSNSARDVFVHDRATQQTSRVSVSSTGQQGNAKSGESAISADGRYLAFESMAGNLVMTDTITCSTGGGYASCYDVFLRDRQTAQTVMVSVGSDGRLANGSSYAPAMTPDGRFIAFETRSINLIDGGAINYWQNIFVHDMLTGRTSLVTFTSDNRPDEDADSFNPAISADGRYVAFSSLATNLVGPGNDTNGVSDVFLRDQGGDAATPTPTGTSSPTSTALPASPTATPTATATATPRPGQTANVLGQLLLQGRPSATPHPSNSITVTLALFLPDTQTVVYSTTLTTDGSARFTAAGVLAGTYDLQVKGSHTLSRKLSRVALASGDNPVDWAVRGPLEEGDADGNNTVSILDFSMLRTSLNRCVTMEGFDSRTDFNNDGCVTIVDFSLLRGSFNRSGE